MKTTSNLPAHQIKTRPGATVGLVILLFVLGAAFLVILVSCSSTQRAIDFQSRSLAGVSNVVEVVRHDVFPFVPAPWAGVAEGAGAVAIALLGLWGKSLHKRQTALEQGALRVPVDNHPTSSQQRPVENKTV